MGSKVVAALINEGHTVVCTKRKGSDLSRLINIKKSIMWIPASIDAIDVASKYTSFDYVFNIACNYGRENMLYDDVIEANIEFPLKVLNKVVENGTKKFLTIGTGLPEEFNMYSFSKKVLGNFGKFYVDKHNIDFYNLKLEMFYGVDEPKDRFIPKVIEKMVKGQLVEITPGTQKRDIIAIKDVIKAIMMIINSGLQGYQEISVGTGIGPSISEIIDFIWEETGRRSEIHKGTIPLRKNEPTCIADTSVLCSLGEWKPMYWKSGLKSMIENIKINCGA